MGSTPHNSTENGPSSFVQNPIEAVVFDIDGLLVDSEPTWHEAELHCFKKVGLILDPEDCHRTTGLRIDSVVEYWFARRPWDEKISTRKQVAQDIIDFMVNALSTRAIAKEGVRHAIDFVKSKGYRLALATSSSPPIAKAGLGCLGILNEFELLCSAEAETHGKPHPAVYLTCAEKLGVDPQRCIALEDSLNGVLAAKAARMQCIAIPEVLPASPKFAIADLILKSLNDINEETWAKAMPTTSH